jgi:hypothetical protein
MDIIDRLHEIANAIADANYSELTMRIPAEPDRDADLVVSSAAREIARLRAELAECKQDAERYRWLRLQHWDTGPLAVVRSPKDAIKLGHDSPSNERLDTYIDAAMAGGE